MPTFYKNKPIEVIEGIEVFSKKNFYIENYETISNVHLKEYFKTGRNPFIQEKLWQDSETDTQKVIDKYSKDGLRILDVGVGMGRLLSNYKNLDRYGMDISIGYLTESKKKGINVCFSMIEDMPYLEESFDIVVSTDVLEHVLDLNFCFEKIVSVLKKYGILVLRVPYKENLQGYLAKDYPFKFAHLRNFDEYSLQLFCEKIFKLQHRETVFTGYFPIIEKLRFRNKIFFYFIYIILLMSEKISKALYKTILKTFFYPIELIMVYQKI
jgi:2-polyprenyl-3-methyl-5-hydroxy-6-metoxy-1,4-benzoquinol methylase